MKALSIRQPWARLIMARIKPVENRRWSTSYRGRILIHAAKTDDWHNFFPWAVEQGLMSIFNSLVAASPIRCPRGVILGEATLSDCVTEFHSPWFTGPYGLVLTDARAYAEPIPYKGRLGLFNVELPEKTNG